MQVGVRLPVRFLAILLLAVPGLVGLEVYYRLAGRPNTLSRTRLVAFSTVVSLSSLLVLYLGSPLYLDRLVRATGDGALAGLPAVESLPVVPLPAVVLLYLLHSGVATAIGTAVGFMSDSLLNRGIERDRRDPWSYAFQHHIGGTNEVVVVLDDGRRVAGSLVEAAWDGDTRELYVRGATLVGDAGEEPPGELVLFTEAAVSHVYFPERDPNWEAVSSGDRPDESRRHGSRLTQAGVLRRVFERVRSGVSSDTVSESGPGDTLRVDTDELSPGGAEAVDSGADSQRQSHADGDASAQETTATDEGDDETSTADESGQT